MKMDAETKYWFTSWRLHCGETYFQFIHVNFWMAKSSLFSDQPTNPIIPPQMWRWPGPGGARRSDAASNAIEHKRGKRVDRREQTRWDAFNRPTHSLGRASPLNTFQIGTSNRDTSKSCEFALVLSNRMRLSTSKEWLHYWTFITRFAHVLIFFQDFSKPNVKVTFRSWRLGRSVNL